jgi:MFS family permease
MKEKTKVYSAIFLVYLTQGLMYFTSLSALPAFFGLYPGLFTIAQQNIFIMIAKSAPLVKIGYGALVDRALKSRSASDFRNHVLSFFNLAVAVVVVLGFSAAVPLVFLFLFAGLFLLVAFFDACVDAIAVRFSSRDSRIGLVSFMNISYSVGTMVGSVVYLMLPRTTSAEWFRFVNVIGISGVVLLVGLVVVLIKTNTALTEVPGDPKPETGPGVLQEDQTDNVQLVSGAVSRTEYKKITIIMMALLFLANIDALVEITTEKWMVERFGQEGFDHIVNFSFSVALPIKIALLIALFLLRSKVSGKEIPILYGCALFSFIYWSLIWVADLGFILVLILISQIIGVLLVVGMSGLMMRFVPRDRAGAGYQFFTLWYNIPLLVLPAVGNSLYGVVGHGTLFLTIAAVILVVIFPLLRRFDRVYGRIAITVYGTV